MDGQRGIVKSSVTALDRLAYMGNEEWARWSFDLREELTKKARRPSNETAR